MGVFLPKFDIRLVENSNQDMQQRGGTSMKIGTITSVSPVLLAYGSNLQSGVDRRQAGVGLGVG